MDMMNLEILGVLFVIFGMIALTSYLRILFILNTIDHGLENPPLRPYLHDKLRSYRDWCKDRSRKPVLLISFALGVIGAVLCWFPIPWLIYH